MSTQIDRKEKVDSSSQKKQAGLAVPNPNYSYSSGGFTPTPQKIARTCPNRMANQKLPGAPAFISRSSSTQNSHLPNKLNAALGFQTTLELLPHQMEVLKDIKTRILGLVAGYGSGKTFTVARKAIQLCMLNPGTDGIITEPSHPLLTQILIPELHAALKQFRIPYTFKVGEKIFYLQIGDHQNRILLASADNYTKLIGVNASFVILDEFDTMRAQVSYEAFIKLLGRLRAGNVRQMVIVSTPEGFSSMHRIFVKEKDKHQSRLIHAKTTDNFFLPEDFIASMLGSYSPTQQQAYINGDFVNLNQESIFDFDRIQNHATVDLELSDKDIYMSVDFNIGGCVTISALYIEDEVYIFYENVDPNTFAIRDTLTEKFKDKDIWCAADASGAHKSTNATTSDHEILSEVPGLTFIQGTTNPQIQDSILAVNAAFRTKKLWIDTNKCPKLTEALEQHAYGIDGRPIKVNDHPSTDDYTDTIRYLVWALIPINKPTWTNYSQTTGTAIVHSIKNPQNNKA